MRCRLRNQFGSIEFQESGTVHNLATLAHISWARVTQIMDLLLLAPEIQEEVLFLPLVEQGKESHH